MGTKNICKTGNTVMCNRWWGREREVEVERERQTDRQTDRESEIETAR